MPILLLLVFCVLGGEAAAAQRPAEYVVFVTLDGVRPEDFFEGADARILADPKAGGIADSVSTRTQFWRATAEERRRAMMPFLWDSLIPAGVAVGALQGAPVRITNGLKFSGPGYMELFTGQAQADVTSNEDRRYPHRTIFDVVHDAPGARETDAAAFTSWDVQGRLVSSRPDAVVVSAGNEPLVPLLRTPQGQVIETLSQRVLHDDRSLRFDAFTHALALEFLLRHRPRLLHIGYGETDVDAHARRYDRYLEMLRQSDGMLRELWQTIQADSLLRGRTALIISTDHGRGTNPANWTDHGKSTQGAENIWVVAVGAGVARRGLVMDAPMTQSQVGPTILTLLGLDPQSLGSGAALPATHFLASTRNFR